MKALIFTMTCGEGHNMIAKSLAQACENANVEYKILQTFGYNEKRVARENKKFLWACKYIPKLYDFVWNRLRKKDTSTNKLPYYVKKCLKYFKEQIALFCPDIIICTHYFASSVIAYMKKQNLLKKNIVTSTILFDFCLAPYWEHSVAVDYIFQPHHNTTNDLIEKGYSKDQILTFGLPIRDEFFKQFNKTFLRKELGLKNIFTVLNVGGGNGLGNTLKLLKSVLSINNDLQIIIINGKNKKNYNKIQKYIEKNKIKNVVNLGFVNNMDKYMKACDIIISRCGGCGLSEIFAVGKPFIIRENMILNEKINKNYFINEGCALGLNKITDAGKQVKILKEDTTLYNNMVENIKKIQYNDPAKKIVNFLIDKAKEKQNKK